jgi:hypothetical protein
MTCIHTVWVSIGYVGVFLMSDSRLVYERVQSTKGL